DIRNTAQRIEDCRSSPRCAVPNVRFRHRNWRRKRRIPEMEFQDKQNLLPLSMPAIRRMYRCANLFLLRKTMCCKLRGPQQSRAYSYDYPLMIWAARSYIVPEEKSSSVEVVNRLQQAGGALIKAATSRNR